MTKAKPLAEAIKDVTYSSDMQQKTSGAAHLSCKATIHYLGVTLGLALQPHLLLKMSRKMIKEWKHKAAFLGTKRKLNAEIY